MLRPQTLPPAPWRPDPPPGRRHGPLPTVRARLSTASEGLVLATRWPPLAGLGRVLLSYQTHPPAVTLCLTLCRPRHPGPLRGGAGWAGRRRPGREVRCLSPGPRAQRGSSRCWPISGRPCAARSGPRGSPPRLARVAAGPCRLQCLARCPPRAGKPLLFSKCFLFQCLLLTVLPENVNTERPAGSG